ncbi:MAG: PilZ domain-containing protein, partial [Desulfobacterales bacterium]|nr:PilZ domain-containing protein [Desulfobacterales bacterium]
YPAKSKSRFIQISTIGTEMIQGKNRLNIFEQLRKDKTLIQVYLLGRDYKQLTIVTNIQYIKNTPFFFIDYTRGFKEAVSGVEVWKMRFEFIGNDKLKYLFRTSGGEIIGNEICIKFPESIERIQRRAHFRIEVLLKTKLHFKKESVDIEMDVVDISLKGALVSSAPKNIILTSGENLKNVKLVFPFKEKDMIVHIKKVLIKRLKKDSESKRYTYGLYFAITADNEEILLKKIISELQIKFLQKRQRMYE